MNIYAKAPICAIFSILVNIVLMIVYGISMSAIKQSSDWLFGAVVVLIIFSAILWITSAIFAFSSYLRSEEKGFIITSSIFCVFPLGQFLLSYI